MNPEHKSSETAADVLRHNVPQFADTTLISEVVEQLRETAHKYSSVNYVYFTNPQGKLSGTLSIKELLGAGGHYPAKDLMQTKITSVLPEIDQEHVALTAIRHNIKAVPVVSSDGVLLGVVQSDTILKVLHSEMIEDAIIRSGVSLFADPIESLRTGNAWLHFRRRIPWLIVGLVGGLLAAFVIRYFEATLEELVLLAIFIPLVVYIADAVGVQSQIMLIRSIALPHTLRMKQYWIRELKVTSLIALTIATLLYGMSFLLFQNGTVSVILAVAVFFGITLSVFIALLLPTVLRWGGFDPALASGPLVTVCCDTTSLLVYFLTANIIL